MMGAARGPSGGLYRFLFGASVLFVQVAETGLFRWKKEGV